MTAWREENGNYIFAFRKGGSNILLYLFVIPFLGIGSILSFGLILYLIDKGLGHALSSKVFPLLVLFDYVMIMVPVFILSRISSTQVHQRLPARFILNPAEKILIIEEYGNITLKLSFSLFQSIDKRSYIVSGDESSTQYWVLSLIKKDGGYIDLFQSVRQEDIDLALSEIGKTLNFENAPQEEDSQELIRNRFITDETLNEKDFRWDNTYSFLPLLFVMIFLLLFTYAAVLLIGTFIPGLIFTGLILSVFYIVTVRGIITAVQSSRNHYNLNISSDYLRFGLVSRKKRIYKTLKEIPLDQIRKIYFNFDLEKESRYPEQRDLLVLDDTSARYVEDMKNRSLGLGDLVTILKNEQRILRITITGLKISEMLVMEKMIEKAIREVGGNVI